MAGKPGRSGRKRQGAEPKVYFNSRIDPELRDQLQAEADSAGRSLSNEIELRLRSTFKRSDRKTDEPTRALCFLIGEAARLVSEGDRCWWNDGNRFKAFEEAVTNILTIAIGAHGVAQKPPKFEHPLFKSVEQFGSSIAFSIADRLLTAEKVSEASSDFPDNDPRAYAQVARVLGQPVDWWKREQKRRLLAADPVAQAIERKYFSPPDWMVEDPEYAPEEYENEWIVDYHDELEARWEEIRPREKGDK